MPYSFTRERRIEFAETDMAGIAHFSNYYRFMEETEHAFIRSLGFDLHWEDESSMHGWVRVNAACDFMAPLHYMDAIQIELLVRRVGASSISYDFLFRRQDESKLLARGSMTVVHVCGSKAEKSMRKQPVPDTIRALLQVAPEEVLKA
jgi:acyl-CoA thioester hydrolase